MTYSGAVATSSPAVTKISQQTLAAIASTVDFTSIPSTYATLELVLTNLATNGGNTTNADTVMMRFNDATTGYMTESHRLTASTVATTSSTAATSIPIANIYGGAGTGAGNPLTSGARTTIYNYAKAAYRNVVSHSSVINTTSTTSWRDSIFFGVWTEQTTPINKITLLTNSGLFQVGTILTLYGLA